MLHMMLDAMSSVICDVDDGRLRSTLKARCNNDVAASC